MPSVYVKEVLSQITSLCYWRKIRTLYLEPLPELSLGSRSWGFSVAIMSTNPGYSYRKQKENRTKRSSSRAVLFPSCLLHFATLRLRLRLGRDGQGHCVLSPKTVPQCTLTTISTWSPATPQSGEYLATWNFSNSPALPGSLNRMKHLNKTGLCDSIECFPSIIACSPSDLLLSFLPSASSLGSHTLAHLPSPFFWKLKLCFVLFSVSLADFFLWLILMPTLNVKSESVRHLR